MNKITMNKGKRVIYILCFACMMLIDWSRGGPKWVYWATCINLVGVVMSIVMACAFIWKDQFRKGGPWKRYVVWLALWLLGSTVGYLLWKQQPGRIFQTQYLTAALSVLCLGMVALRIWTSRRDLRDRGATFGNPILIGIWGVMTVLMVCSPIDEIWQLYYLVIFGMFYVIPYEKAEREVLWISVADGVILGFFLIQIWAYGFRPYDVVRYAGAYGNCNINALFYLVTYICVLYRLHDMWNRKEQGRVGNHRLFTAAQVLFYLLAAGLCGFMLMTITRTALLVGGLVTVVFGVLELCVYHRLKVHKVLLHLAMYGVCVVLLFPCVYATVRYLPTILHHPVWWDGEYAPWKVHSYDAADSEKYVSFEELLEEVFLRLAGITVDIHFEKEEVVSDATMPVQNVLTIMPMENLEELFTVKMLATALPDTGLLQGKEADSSMGIRQFIWKTYLSNLNFTGHELEEGYFQVTPYYQSWHAQNVLIQVLFYYGIPAGILFAVLMAVLGIQALRAAVRNRDTESLLLLLVWTVFMGYGMLECVWYMGQSILFLMYLAPKVLIDRRK